LKDILYKIVHVVTSRVFILFLVLTAAFGLIWAGLYNIQVTKTEYYQQKAMANVFQEVQTTGQRGCIYDRSGRPLAVNIKTRELFYTPDTVNPNLNQSIDFLLDLIAKSHEEISLDQEFPIGYNENAGFYFKDDYNVTTNEIGLYNFIAEIYGTSRDQLTSQQKEVSAEEAFWRVCDHTFGIEHTDIDRMLQIAQIRYAIFSGRFNQTHPVRIMRQISESTEAKIMERHADFVGFSVEDTYTRQYPEGELFAHIVGYVGKISDQELEEKKEQGSSYEVDDTIGKSGLELTFEDKLRGKTGTKRIELNADTMERVSETDLTQADPGDSIFLTIDSEVQKQVYDALYKQIKSLLLDKITGQKSDDGSTYSVEDILIALIDNNFIPSQTLESSGQPYASSLLSMYQSESVSQLEALQDLILNQKSVAVGSYNEIQKDLYDYMIENMRDAEHLSYDYQKDEAIYPAYKAGQMSPYAFLSYAISHNYLDVSSYGIDKGTDADQALEEIIHMELDKLEQGSQFRNRIYHYLIESGAFPAVDFMDLLYENGLISDADGSREKLNSGELAPIDCLKAKISQDEITPADIDLDPCSGSVVVSDPTSGEVLAMVSYPTYDPNLFMNDVDYFNRIVADQSGPLVFRAVNETRAIGSTFKMCTAIAGLDQGVITKDTVVHDNVVFEYANSPDKPRCWNEAGHGDVNVVTALDHSCNYFFYNVGYLLCHPDKDHKFEDYVGLDTLASYAERLGLASKTGIEISETEPHASDSDAVRSSIGQGTTAYSCANLNRYTNTLADGGIVRDLYLVDAVHDSRGRSDWTREDHTAQSGISQDILDTVKEGMRMMVTDEHAKELSVLDAVGIHTAGKTGTAQEREDRPDHSLFTGYAPLDDPEISISVVIPFGGGSSNAIPVFRDLVADYYGLSLDSK